MVVFEAYPFWDYRCEPEFLNMGGVVQDGKAKLEKQKQPS